MVSLHGAHKRVFSKSVAAQLSGDLAAPQYDDARAHGEHVAGVGRREEDGEAIAGKLGDQVVDGHAGPDVDARGRLAEDEQRRLTHQAARDDDLLLVPPAQRGDRRPGAGGDDAEALRPPLDELRLRLLVESSAAA